MTQALLDEPVVAPASFPINQFLANLDPKLIKKSAYRVEICRHSPMLFAIVYLRKYLRSKHLKGLISMCQFHIDIAKRAKRWSVGREWEPSELREVVIGPREVGKTVWQFLILPLWAMAYGHRRYLIAFADVEDQAKGHLSTLRMELETNTLLQIDFPQLCRPLRRDGRTVADNAHMYKAASGAMFHAKGITARTAGARHNEDRPDLMLFDDVEPQNEEYSMDLKEARRRTITDMCFSMNIRAIVQISGTTMMYGSIIHDCVRAATGGKIAPWITEENITIHYYPGLTVDEYGNECSLWEQKWPLEWLLKHRQDVAFAMNIQNNPLAPDRPDWWHEDAFRFNVPFPINQGEAVLVIDPATTSHQKSDYTGMAIVSTNGAENLACVEWARGVKLTPGRLKDYIHEILRQYPAIRYLLIETNQGGDTWAEIIKPGMPRSVEMRVIPEHAPKPTRIAEYLAYCEASKAFIRTEQPGFQDQCRNYHGSKTAGHDDIVDAVAKGCRFWLSSDPQARGRIAA